VVVSVNVEKRVDGPGEAHYASRAWKLKERIRHEEGVLKQRRGFFMDAYRRSTTHLFLLDGDLVAFASVRRDGYILFLAVAPEYRGEGYGRQLVAEVAENYRTVTCHARTTNEDALHFYEHIGFEITRRIDNYYEDNGDAYYLKLGGDDKESLLERIRGFVS
jgi:ribosomal protein S18 acetylase RimI-like enzyme